MDSRTTVRLHKYQDRPFGLRWRVGNRSGEVTSGTHDEREALRRAWRLEDDLAKGYRPDAPAAPALTWKEYRQRYEDEYLADMSLNYRKNWRSAKAKFEEVVRPRYVAEIDAATISRFRGELRKTLSPGTADTYARVILSGINWGASVGMHDAVRMPRRRGGSPSTPEMRNRSITLEEFERMVSLALQRPARGAEVARFLWGLWHSGLRISELYRLTWSPSGDICVVEGDLPLIAFRKQKNKKVDYLPGPPEFWQLVYQPGYPRSGPVFSVPGWKGSRMLCSSLAALVRKYGKQAGVVVHTETGRTASPHDIRATFLSRLSETTNEAILAKVARHANPITTRKHYIRHDATSLAKTLGWEAGANQVQPGRDDGRKPCK
ncbi:Phage integrase family protein [Planctomycetes bacterium MalM25]|nr:Phage integrase family protein [Planctomycetes bacterium MalM25]